MVVLILVCSMLLTACGGEFPEVSDDELNEVSEYAARLLLKYDANHRSRLVSMEEVEARNLRDQKRREAAQARAEALDNAGMDPVDDTQVIDNTQNVVGGGADVVTYHSMQEYWELPAGVQVVYNGYDVVEDLANDFFSIEASEGKRLILLHFRLENQSEEEQFIDILGQNTVFKATFNGDYKRTALTTMLMEDLATYKGSVVAGNGVDTMLVFEVDEVQAAQISSISLNLKNDSKTYTIQLL